MTKYPYIFIFFILFCSFQAGTQQVASSTTVREEVKSMFDKKVKNVWVVLSSGKLDGVHIVDMAFGTDGKTYRGFYYLRSSGERFELEGEESDGIYTFIETNKRGKTTGFVIGAFDGQKFTGDWIPVDKSRKLPFETMVLESFDTYQPVLCDHKMWQAYYQGKIDNLPAQVYASKHEHDYHVYVKWNGITKTDSFNETTGNYVFSLSLTESHKIIFDFDAGDYLVVENNVNNQNFLLYKEAYAQFECFEFANFTTRLETIRPVFPNKKFVLWLDDEFNKWHEQGRKKISVHTDEAVVNHHRYTDIGYGWVEISYLDNNFISGHIFTQSSWKKGTEKKSFIFDTKASKILEPASLLQESFMDPLQIDSIVTSKIKNICYNDPKLKEWVCNQPFNHITLHEKGLSFQTKFSNIFGEHEVIITYEELKPLLKNKSVLRNL
jgi:hypothetical protein